MKSRVMVLGLVLVGILATGAAAATHTVQVVNFEFNPRNLTIMAGDTIRWEWGSGFHTTTNGLGASDPDAGTMWDESMSMGNPVFERQFNSAGVFPYFCRPHEFSNMKGTITVELATEVFSAGSGPPESYELGQNYPNPFNPVTQIDFSLPAATEVQLKVYNIMGGEVATLVNENLEPGTYSAEWDGRDENGLALSTGVYFYRLSTSEYVSTRKMVLLK